MGKDEAEERFRKQEGPLAWAKIGLIYLAAGAAIFCGGLKTFNHYSAKTQEYESRIPSEYFSVKELVDEGRSLSELELVVKLEDPNFVDNYRYAVNKYHQYREDADISKNIKKVEAHGGEIIGVLGVAAGAVVGLVGTGSVGAGIYSFGKRLKKKG